jgi:integration host factor subunit alpha
MSFAKEDIIDSLHNDPELQKKESVLVLDSLLEIIKKTLGGGEDVLISGFAEFCVKDRNDRKGRNPAAGEDMKMWERRVVTLKCSGVLKEKANG